MDVGLAGLIASRLAPTGFGVCMSFVSAEDPVWELARDSGGSVTWMLGLLASSRASPLPQVLRCA